MLSAGRVGFSDPILYIDYFIKPLPVFLQSLLKFCTNGRILLIVRLGADRFHKVFSAVGTVDLLQNVVTAPFAPYRIVFGKKLIVDRLELCG